MTVTDAAVERPTGLADDPRLVAGGPTGPIEGRWDRHKFDMKLVNPSNKRKYEIIVVGSGLAGASAAASMAQLGYKVKVFTFHDSPRRAHSIAAQGGIRTFSSPVIPLVIRVGQINISGRAYPEIIGPVQPVTPVIFYQDRDLPFRADRPQLIMLIRATDQVVF